MLNRKKRIFIASSKESVKIATGVMKYLSSNLPADKYECVIWKDNFYSLSDTTYKQLLSKSISFDYAVIICGQDDMAIRNDSDPRQKVNFVARDNVYWEFGLFVGVLSHEKVFCVCDQECKLASDLSGDNIIIYKTNKNGSINNINYKLKPMLDKIYETEKIQNIALLPTTSLALNYFHNFIEPISQRLNSMTTIEYKGKNYHLYEEQKRIYVVIPNLLTPNIRNYASSYNSEKKFIGIKVPAPDGFNRDIFVNGWESDLEKGKFQIYDIPTILESALRTVDYVMAEAHNGDTNESKIAKYKAIDDFCESLMIHINNSRSASKYVHFIFDSNTDAPKEEI